ncbi:MAG TPA: TlpA disulfide reductase family protein [Pirellulales bacterium]|nr:TlpA disulfide reductase family protein [Pirellulales bacterium]
MSSTTYRSRWENRSEAEPVSFIAFPPANFPGVKLADPRGKWVLLDFWGYWFGPCVGRMPELMALYDEYKDKGLAVIGIHCDGEQDAPLDTVEKLDEKLKDIVTSTWSGRDLPFPVALTCGLESFVTGGEATALGPVAADYGITSYPSLMLIDPEGNVVGLTNLRDVKERLQALDPAHEGRAGL